MRSRRHYARPSGSGGHRSTSDCKAPGPRGALVLVEPWSLWSRVASPAGGMSRASRNDPRRSREGVQKVSGRRAARDHFGGPGGVADTGLPGGTAGRVVGASLIFSSACLLLGAGRLDGSAAGSSLPSSRISLEASALASGGGAGGIAPLPPPSA